jgi:hypothetical protein
MVVGKLHGPQVPSPTMTGINFDQVQYVVGRPSLICINVRLHFNPLRSEKDGSTITERRTNMLQFRIRRSVFDRVLSHSREATMHAHTRDFRFGPFPDIPLDW